MSGADPSAGTELFERALKNVLRPMMRMLISKGIAAPAFYRLVKQTYVETAVDMLGDAATDSRVSVMTGVHRRDVKDFRDPDRTEEETLRRKVSVLISVVGRWLSDPVYTDAKGNPAPVARTGEGASFETLVRSVNRDVRPRTVLDELIRQNIVCLRDGDVVLDPVMLVGPADSDQRLHFFAQNVGDHMAAAVENVLSDTPQMLERAVFYNHLTESSVSDIQSEVRAVSQDALLKINALAAEKQASDKATKDGSHRFRFGLFFYSEDETASAQGRDPQ